MVKIFYCIMFLSKIQFMATAPMPFDMQEFAMDENNLVEIEKVLKTIQYRLHQISPEHEHKDGDGVLNQELAIAPGEEPEQSKLFFMLYVAKKPENPICDNEQFNENYTIEGYNYDLKCKCRFCIRNMIDKNYEERCFPDPCEIESVGDDSGSEDTENETDEDPVVEALNVLQERFTPPDDNLTNHRNPLECESKPCDRPDMEEINRIRCRGNECYFRYI